MIGAMKRTEFVSKIDKKTVVRVSDLHTAHAGKDTIYLIKSWRTLTGEGLKESKDAIQKLLDNIPYKTDINGFAITGDPKTGNQWNEKTYNQMMQGFADESYNPELTREEFMNMISGALDSMDKFHCTNMIEAVEFMFANVKKNGGLEMIARKNDAFLDGI